MAILMVKLSCQVLLLMSCFLCGNSVFAVSEYQLKAVFVYNLINYIKWPKQSFSRGDSPYQLCVFGQDPFGVILDVTVQDQVIKQRSILIKRTASLTGLSMCHILFVSYLERENLTNVLQQLKSLPILIVSDINDSTRKILMINLYKQKNRIRLAINLTRLRQTGLKPSAQLLKIAKIIK